MYVFMKALYTYNNSIKTDNKIKLVQITPGRVKWIIIQWTPKLNIVGNPKN